MFTLPQNKSNNIDRRNKSASDKARVVGRESLQFLVFLERFTVFGHKDVGFTVLSLLSGLWISSLNMIREAELLEN